MTIPESLKDLTSKTVTSIGDRNLQNQSLMKKNSTELLSDAEKKYTDAVKEHGKDSQEAKDAGENLKTIKEKVKNADYESLKNTKESENAITNIGFDRFHLNENNPENKKNYRTLDFSSVGLYDGNNLSADKTAMRRWHQMTLYMEGPSTGGNFSGGKYVIASNLPENFSYSITSTYEPPLGSFNSSMTNLILQGLTKGEGSGVIRAGSALIWKGTSPLKFKVKIPVMDDAWPGDNQNGFKTDFMEALEILGTFLLPRDIRKKSGDGSKLKQFIVNNSMTPPPTPLHLNASFKLTKTKSFQAKQPDGTVINDNRSESLIDFNFQSGHSGNIMVQLGGMLLVNNCVLTQMIVEYPNTKSMIRHEYGDGKYITDNTKIKNYLTPIIANLTLEFTTVSMLTRGDYLNMLWLNPKGQGGANFTVDPKLDISVNETTGDVVDGQS